MNNIIININSVLQIFRHIRKSSLLRNSFYIMGTTISSSALGYLYWVIAARAYSPAEVGLVAALIGVMTLTSNLSNIGLGSVLIQLLPQKQSVHEWSVTLSAALLTGSVLGFIIGFIVVLALSALSPQFAIIKDNLLFFLTFAFGVSLWTITTITDATFIAERSSIYTFIRNLAFAIIKIVLLVVPLLFIYTGPFDIFASWVFGTLFAGLIGFFLLTRLKSKFRPTYKNLTQEIRSMTSSLAGHYFINLGGHAPMYLLPLIVTIRLSATENAYYYTTWMVGSLFFMISPAVSTSLFAEGSHDSEKIYIKARTSIYIISSLLLPSILVFLLTGKFILGIFGNHYAQEGYLLLVLLTISAIPDAISTIYISILRIKKRLRSAAILNLGMAVLAIGLAWWLLPFFGIAGVGLAWLSAQCVGCLFVAYDYFILTRGDSVIINKTSH